LDLNNTWKIEHIKIISAQQAKSAYAYKNVNKKKNLLKMNNATTTIVFFYYEHHPENGWNTNQNIS
jgi:hypothetical protein